MKKTIEKKLTANEFTNVADISGSCLETKDGYLIAYLRIYPFNLDLITIGEKRAKTNTLAAAFQDGRGDFAYVSYPREIDLEKYNVHLKQLYESEIVSVGRKRILAEMIRESSDLVLSGENFEHQHFLKIWTRKRKDKSRSEIELMQRAGELKNCFSRAGIKTEILTEIEIIKLCNLFGNALQATYEHVDESSYLPISVIR